MSYRKNLMNAKRQVESVSKGGETMKNENARQIIRSFVIPEINIERALNGVCELLEISLQHAPGVLDYLTAKREFDRAKAAFEAGALTERQFQGETAKFARWSNFEIPENALIFASAKNAYEVGKGMALVVPLGEDMPAYVSLAAPGVPVLECNYSGDAWMVKDGVVYHAFRKGGGFARGDRHAVNSWQANNGRVTNKFATAYHALTGGVFVYTARAKENGIAAILEAAERELRRLKGEETEWPSAK